MISQNLSLKKTAAAVTNFIMAELTNFGKGTSCVGALLFLTIWLYTPICWIVNLVKLIKLVMASPEPFIFTKHIVIHAVGLIPPVSWVTAWM
jgi:hypothetical protein